MSRRSLLKSFNTFLRTQCTPFCSFSPPEKTGGIFLQRSWFWTSRGAHGEVISFPLAQTGEGIAECELVKWLIKEGDEIKQFDKICEVQSDKASIEISSPYNGTIKSTPHEVGDVILVGNTLVEIEVDEHSSPVNQTGTTQAPNPPQEWGKNEHKRPLASPTVRLFARENNVDLSLVEATGPGRRILKEDVESFLQNRSNNPGTSCVSWFFRLNCTFVSGRRVEIKGYRRSMFKSMTASLTIPHFHFCDDFDLTEVANLRQQLESDERINGVNLTYLPILIKALSTALIDYPEVNSSLSPDQSALILHPDHNIGVAMMTEDGLVVPNIKCVQQKSILDISQELDRLKKVASDKKLTSVDISDTTITVSNIGPIGGRYANPLVTPPQTAIVAIGRVRTAVLPGEGGMKTIHAFPCLPISWGADHRVLDGATLVKFSNKWKSLIEDPARLILTLK
eukprot:g2038.t1